MPPSEFWSMRPRHFWYLLEVETQNDKPSNSVSATEARQLRKMMDLKNAAYAKSQS